MVRLLMVLAFVVLLGGRTARSMTIASEIDAVNVTTPDDQDQDDDVSTDLEIHNILIEVTNRIFRPDDADLISLIKRGIQEAAKSHSETTRASIEAGSKKAQRYVSDVTSAYTQAIFRANSAEEAQNILQRFQNTVQLIVDSAKTGQLES